MPIYLHFWVAVFFFFPSDKTIELHYSQCLRPSTGHVSSEKSFVHLELLFAQIMSTQWIGTIVSPFLLPAEGE